MGIREKKTLEALMADGMYLGKLRNLTYERCMAAVAQTGMALQFVPESLMTMEMARIAARNSPLALAFVPGRLQTYEMVEEAVSVCGDALEFVSPDLINKRLVITAVENDPFSIRFAPREIALSEAGEMAIAANPEVAALIPGGIPDEWKEALEKAKEPEEPKYIYEMVVEALVSWNPDTGEIAVMGRPKNRPDMFMRIDGKSESPFEKGSEVRAESKYSIRKIRVKDQNGNQLSNSEGKPLFINKVLDATFINPEPALEARQRQPMSA